MHSSKANCATKCITRPSRPGLRTRSGWFSAGSVGATAGNGVRRASASQRRRRPPASRPGGPNNSRQTRYACTFRFCAALGKPTGKTKDDVMPRGHGPRIVEQKQAHDPSGTGTTHARPACAAGTCLCCTIHPLRTSVLSEHWGAARTSQILPTRTRPRQPASHEKHEWHTLICLLAFLRGAAPASSMAGDQTRNEHMCRWTRETKKSQMRTSSAQRRSQNGPRHFAQGERARTRDEGGEVRRGVGVAQMPSDYSPAAFSPPHPASDRLAIRDSQKKKQISRLFPMTQVPQPGLTRQKAQPAARPPARPAQPSQRAGRSGIGSSTRFALCSFSAREPHPLTRQDGDCGCPLRLADPLTVAPRARSEIGGKGSVVGSPGAGNMHPSLRALGRANGPARFHGLPQKEG